MKKNILYLFPVITIILTNLSCIDESVIESDINKIFEYNVLILNKAEEKGDFINSRDFPAMLNAEDIYPVISDYFIIDVRTQQNFNKGFIKNSINVQPNELFDFVTNLKSNKDMLLVSTSGQASAYYTSLFRLLGLKNIYSLKFGIAGWNKKFENEILDYCGNRSLKVKFYFNPKDTTYSLPNFNSNTSFENIEFAYNERIKNLFAEGFNEHLSTTNFEEPQSNINSNNFAYLFSSQTPNDFFVIATASTDIIQDITFPINMRIFQPFSTINDFASGRLLQKIPPTKIIMCYSYSGQLSAMVTAYLRLLGYNARSVLFGVQNYSNTIIKNTLGTGRKYTFKGSNNFPIVEP